MHRTVKARKEKNPSSFPHPQKTAKSYNRPRPKNDLDDEPVQLLVPRPLIPGKTSPVIFYGLLLIHPLINTSLFPHSIHDNGDDQSITVSIVPRKKKKVRLSRSRCPYRFCHRTTDQLLGKHCSTPRVRAHSPSRHSPQKTRSLQPYRPLLAYTLHVDTEMEPVEDKRAHTL